MAFVISETSRIYFNLFLYTLGLFPRLSALITYPVLVRATVTYIIRSLYFKSKLNSKISIFFPPPALLFIFPPPPQGGWGNVKYRPLYIRVIVLILCNAGIPVMRMSLFARFSRLLLLCGNHYALSFSKCTQITIERTVFVWLEIRHDVRQQFRDFILFCSLKVRTISKST